ncbi:hypothetical protein [uncultured Campylobacter sp.]|nr:hypothetical protein [uncultured Campylobacter sp.]
MSGEFARTKFRRQSSSPHKIPCSQIYIEIPSYTAFQNDEIKFQTL